MTVQPARAVGSAGAPAPESMVAAVTEVYRGHLDVAGCGPDDSFFGLGGDSLTALRVLAELQRRFRVPLRLVDLFEAGTPRAVAERLAALSERSDAEDRTSVSGARLRVGGYAPLALSQEGFYTMDRQIGGTGYFNNVSYVRWSGDIDPAAIKAAVVAVVHRQTALSVVFGTTSDGPGQRIVDAPPRIAEQDLRSVGQPGVDRVLRREHLVGFDLHAAPPVRFTLLRTADDAWCLVITVHHIVFDALSWTILMDELAYAYRVALGGEKARPDLAVDYTDFAVWQHETLTGDRVEAHLDQLTRILAEPAPWPAAARPTTMTQTSRIERFTVERDTTRGLVKLAGRREATLFVCGAAAVLDFARRRTGVSHQALSVQVANRNWPGSDGLIGCFSNMLYLSADIPAAAQPQELVERMRDAVASTLSMEEFPIDLAVRELAGRGEDLEAQGRLPHLGFALQPASSADQQLPGGRLTAAHSGQLGDSVEPGAQPLVLELFARDGELDGLTRRLAEAWPGDSYASAERELRSTLERFAAVGDE